MDRVISSVTAGWTQRAGAVQFAGLYGYSKVSDGTETGITITPSGGTAGLALDIFELSGLLSNDTPDGANGVTAFPATSLATPTIVTTNADDGIFVVWATADTTQAWSALGPSTSSPTWTPAQQDDNSAVDVSGGSSRVRMLSAFNTVPTTGSYLATATYGQSTGISALILAFKGTSGGAPPPATQQQLTLLGVGS